VKLIDLLSPLFPCQNTAAVIHLRRCPLFPVDEPSSATFSGSQAYQQVRHEPLMLPDPLSLTAGEPPSPERHRSFPAFLPKPAKDQIAMDCNRPRVLSAKRPKPFLFYVVNF
jgi:hypothetical protein